MDFDIGESYAGLLPISSASNETRELYFWFFPSSNPLASNEITIWLNGGPGCSSLEGLLQENGPFLWQYGTFAPVKNPYTWVNLTKYVPTTTSPVDHLRSALHPFSKAVVTESPANPPVQHDLG